MKRDEFMAVLGTGGLLALVPAVRGMEIVGFDPARHERFSKGYPLNPVPNRSPEFVGKGLEWSGVGWEAMQPGKERWLRRALTMISPRHFVYSGHHSYGDSLNGTGEIHFYSPTLQRRVTYAVEKTAPSIRPRHPRDMTNGVPSDLWVGRLTSVLDPAHGIVHYPVLTLPSVAHYRGKELFVYVGVGAKIGRDRIEEVIDHQGQVVVTFQRNPAVQDECFLMPGDSGGPSFVAVEGKLALVGVHYSATTAAQGISVGSFVPAYVEQMRGGGVPVEVVKPKG